MSVKQFNGTYFNQEDRLLLRMSTVDGAEFRLWLTRFMTRHLLVAIHQLVQKNLERIHTPLVAQALQEFQQEGIKSATNFKDDYEPAPHLPMGEEGILVTGLNLSLQKEMLSIDFRLMNEQNINVQLPINAGQSFALLLMQLQESAQWNIDINAEPVLSSTSNEVLLEKKSLH